MPLTKPSALVNNLGETYSDYRKTLKPSLWRPWVEIGIALSLMAGNLTLLVYAIPLGSAAATPAWLLATTANGYLIAFCALFIHEASHYNLARSRLLNDLFCNLIIGTLIGLEVSNYRRVHTQHHRLLGQPTDPERSYFTPLSKQFLIESTTGIRVVKVAATYVSLLRNKTANKDHNSLGPKQMFVWLQAAILHLAIITTLYLTAGLMAALSWIVTMAVVFPFFASVRQVLEHRAESANSAIDYGTTAHGETHRMFGTGLLASTLGGAGFNRHLLHHWDPSVSYTRLPEVERFILGSPSRSELQLHYTTYSKVFKALYEQ